LQKKQKGKLFLERKNRKEEKNSLKETLIPSYDIVLSAGQFQKRELTHLKKVRERLVAIVGMCYHLIVGNLVLKVKGDEANEGRMEAHRWFSGEV